MDNWSDNNITPDLSGLILNRLFKGCDVSEGTKEQNDDIPFIFYWRNMHQKPQWSPLEKKYFIIEQIYYAIIINRNW